MCDLSAALVSALKDKKGDAAISAAAEKNKIKKEDAGLANIRNGLIAPRSQLGFGTVPGVSQLVPGCMTIWYRVVSHLRNINVPSPESGSAPSH